MYGMQSRNNLFYSRELVNLWNKSGCAIIDIKWVISRKEENPNQIYANPHVRLSKLVWIPQEDHTARHPLKVSFINMIIIFEIE